MSIQYGMGSASEASKTKIYYILWMFGVLGFLFWAWIGQTSGSTKMAVLYYILFGFIMGVTPVLFDNATKKGMMESLDTVTVEQPTPIRPKWQLIGSLLIGLLLAFRIVVTGTAFIPYPQFQLFDSVAANAVLSAAFGFVEQWVFFVFAFPTMFALLHKRTESRITAFVLSSLAIAFIFMGFHLFVYAANETALFSVFVFAYFNTVPMYFLRSTIFGDVCHGFNNFFATLYASKVGLAVLGL